MIGSKHLIQMPSHKTHSQASLFSLFVSSYYRSYYSY